MKTFPHRKLSAIVMSLILGGSFVSAQSNSKTYSRSAAMDPGISVQLCQNDMLILLEPGAVKSIGVTLPNNVEALFDGNRAVLRGNATSGRTPVLVLMQNSDDITRLNITGCPTRGVSTLIRIVDDAPAPASAREYTAQPVSAYAAPAQSAPTPITVQPAVQVKPAVTAPISSTTANTLQVATAIGNGGTITLPTPTTVGFELARTSAGVTLTVTNGTAQTLSLTPANLQIVAGGQVVSVPVNIGGSLAPGLIGAYAIPLPSNVLPSDVQATWLAYAPGIKVNFVISAALP